MQEKKNKVLDEFFTGRTVTPINDVKDVKTNDDYFLYVGSNWCGHSQLGTAHFAEACSVETPDGEERHCYGLDLAKEGGVELAEKLGIPNARGVPALFKYNANEEKFENIATGRRMSHEYAEIIKNSEGGGL